MVEHKEVESIARISYIDVPCDEIDGLILHLQEVLTYAARVKEVTEVAEVDLQKAVNIYRADEPYKSDSESLLVRAPEREGDYFVVPIILEGTN